jgi:hypothetical protein
MRVTVFTASILLTSALVSMTALVTAPAKADGSGGICICDEKAKAKPVQRSTARKVVRRVAARPARQGSYYDYGSAGRWQSEWHGEWRVAPNMGPAQGGGYYEEGAAYGPPADEFGGGYDEMAGLQVDRGGWSGGVGGGPDGGGGGGGFGQLHFGQGGNQENGPTYNSYNQSFQYNPSQAAPFQPRLMGGFAPPAK